MLKLHFYNHKTLRHLKKQSFYHCCKCCLCKAYSPDTFQTHLVYNIGKAFFHLLRKHFPPSNRLHKICNKNVVKLSYSCTPNMADILSAHNKKLLKSHNGKPEFKPCNCRYKPSCPLNGNCRDKAIVY